MGLFEVGNNARVELNSYLDEKIRLTQRIKAVYDAFPQVCAAVFLEVYKAAIIDKIQGGYCGGEPLDPWYVEQKQKKGLHAYLTDAYHATGHIIKGSRTINASFYVKYNKGVPESVSVANVMYPRRGEKGRSAGKAGMPLPAIIGMMETGRTVHYKAHYDYKKKKSEIPKTPVYRVRNGVRTVVNQKKTAESEHDRVFKMPARFLMRTVFKETAEWVKRTAGKQVADKVEKVISTAALSSKKRRELDIAEAFSNREMYDAQGSSAEMFLEDSDEGNAPKLNAKVVRARPESKNLAAQTAPDEHEKSDTEDLLAKWLRESGKKL